MNRMFNFLLALAAVLAATANAGEPVLDIFGKPLSDGSYHVVPALYGAAGGGLTFVPFGNHRCPPYIGQESSKFERGIPVKFSNWKSKAEVVQESENLNIEMDVAATICFESTYWWVAPSNLPFMTSLVMAGRKPNPWEDSSKSFFQIKRAKTTHNGYKFSFCSEDESCTDIGIARDPNGVARLALGADLFPVVFFRANDTETALKTLSII